MNSTSSKVSALVSEIYASGINTKDARQNLVSALKRVADSKCSTSRPIDVALKELSKLDNFHWIVSATYWFLRHRGNSLPPGTIFTPPTVARQIVTRLLPDLSVVDLGAGTGMLTLAAAKQGFKVIALEEDAEMVLVLDRLARIMRVRDQIDLRVQNALDYPGGTDQQIMSNPPYTRHQEISSRKKKKLAELSSRLGAELPLTAGHYAYFMIYAWSAKWSQREVLLLPTNWLDTKYGTGLRRILMNRGAHEIAILEGVNGKPVFDNALTTACLITTHQSPTIGNRSQCKPRLRMVGSRTNGQNDLGVGISLARLGNILHTNSYAKVTPDRTIADVFHVKRGIATGSNSFFVFTKSFAHEQGISSKELQPILRRLSLKARQNHFQYIWTPARSPSKASLKRVREGKSLGVDKKYLCDHRRVWWRVDIPDPPTYFMTYMGRGKPIIKLNKRGLLNLNNIHGLYLREGVPRKVGKRLIDWLLSPKGITALMNSARYYQGGLWKLEPGDVERLNIPKRLSISFPPLPLEA